MEAKYQNHYGLSAEFDELCRVTKDKVLEVTKEVKDLIGVSDTALAISKADYVNLMQVFNVNPAESGMKFDHAAQALGGRPGGHTSGQKRWRDEDSLKLRPSRRYRAESPPLPSSDVEAEGEDDGTPMYDSGAGPSSGPV